MGACGDWLAIRDSSIENLSVLRFFSAYNIEIESTYLEPIEYNAAKLVSVTNIPNALVY